MPSVDANPACAPPYPLLQVRNLSVQYGGVLALAPLSFDVVAHSLTLVLGPNGAGKSSLLRALAGAAPPRSGSVLLAGEDVTAVPAFRRVRRGIALVPEGRGRLPTLSVRDNFILGWNAAPPALREPQDVAMAQMFKLFPVLQERLGQDCDTLSGGEMQMLAIARGLLAKPRVLLLDEPSLGLAPLAIARVYDALGTLNAAGLAMIIVEQKVAPLPHVPLTTLVLHNGRVRFHEPRYPSGDELARLYLGQDLVQGASRKPDREKGAWS
jgi:branched-chain amino acid transport system ATP-binding protein